MCSEKCINEGTVPVITSTLVHVHVYTASKWLFYLVSGFTPPSVYLSISCSVVYLPSLLPYVDASGHTVSLLTVTVVLVLEYSTRGVGA